MITSGSHTFKLFTNGKEVSNLYNVQSIHVNREINRISWARIVLSDGDISTGLFEVCDGIDFIPGTQVQIHAGYEGKEQLIFNGIVVKFGIKSLIRGITSLVVDCKDEAYRMTLENQNAIHYKQTDSNLISTLASKYNLKNQLRPTKVSHEALVQYQVCDWEFALNRADRTGHYLITDNGTLVMDQPNNGRPPKAVLIYGEDIIEFETELESRNQFPAIQYSTWNSTQQQLRDVTGQKPTVTEQGNLPSDQLAQVGQTKGPLETASYSMGIAEMKSWADAKWQKSHLGKIVGRIKCQGRYDIKPGDWVTLERMGLRFNGNAFISGIRHAIKMDHWETDIQIGMPKEVQMLSFQKVTEDDNQFLPAITGLHIGQVTQLAGDPKGEERIKVKIPAIDRLREGIWSRLGTIPGAVFRPNIGDEVIIGFMQDNPCEAIILGGLYSSAKPTPLPNMSNSNATKGMITTTGLSMVFDDAQGTILIQSPNGGKIMINDKSNSILLKNTNGHFMLDSKGISINTSGEITINSGGKVVVNGADINLNAIGSFNCKNAQANLMSDGTAIINGSMVQIN